MTALNWLRVVLPHHHAAAVLLLLALFLMAVGVEPLVVLLPLGCCWGCYRVLAFHPLFREEYVELLRRWPWSDDCELPFGPLEIGWQDLVLLAFLSIFTIDSSAGLFLVPLCFLIAYCVCLAGVYRILGMQRAAYSTGYCAGLALLVVQAPEAALSLALAAALCQPSFIRESLVRMLKPDQCALFQHWLRRLRGRMQHEFWHPERDLGWPLACCAPDDGGREMAAGEKFALAGLTVLWLVALESLLLGAAPKESPLAGVFPAVVLLVPLVRWNSYRRRGLTIFRAPISLFGRCTTGRLIVPGYDVVFVGPLLLVLFGVCWASAAVAEQWHTLWYSLGYGLLLLIALICGPGRRSWQLTGRHRRDINATEAKMHRLQQTQ